MVQRERPENPRKVEIEEALAHNVAQKQILTLMWQREHQRDMERESRERTKARKSDAPLTRNVA